MIGRKVVAFQTKRGIMFGVEWRFLFYTSYLYLKGAKRNSSTWITQDSYSFIDDCLTPEIDVAEELLNFNRKPEAVKVALSEIEQLAYRKSK